MLSEAQCGIMIFSDAQPMQNTARMTAQYHALADIGGTKLSVLLVRANTAPFSQSTALLAKCVEPTTQTGDTNAIPLQIVRMVAAACTLVGVTLQQIASVNVATCGLFLNGELVAPNLQHNNHWTSIPLAQTLRAAFSHAGCRIRIENDGVAALMAELRWGALQASNHAAYVTWSTGIGVGLFVDGRVLRGKNGNAGHAGHMVMGDVVASDVVVGDGMAINRALDWGSNLHCACGNLGDAQSQLAGSYIPRRWPAYASAQALLDAARSADAAALSHVDTLCEGMARVLYNLTTTLDLERIAIGGSVFWFNQDLLLPRVQALVAQRFPAMTTGLSIVPAGLGAHVGDFAALAILAGDTSGDTASDAASYAASDTTLCIL
jgi:glucokinase